MPSAEFEEREYEAPLYNQLLQGSGVVWAPGQVLEGLVGIDYSMFTVNPWFWRLHDFDEPPLGVVLGRGPLGRWWNEIVETRPAPDFALNLFIQAKRPIVGKRAPKKLAGFGIKGAYWKFDLEQHQQAALLSLAQVASNRALICYAAPAFDRLSQLYAHQKAGTIVEASTFPSAQSLATHTSWYYNTPGCGGAANPSLERIDGPSLQESIAALLARRNNNVDDRESAADSIKSLASAIAVALGDERVGNEPRAALYFERLREIDLGLRTYRPRRAPELLRSYLAVATFAKVFRLQWLVLGEA